MSIEEQLLEYVKVIEREDSLTGSVEIIAFGIGKFSGHRATATALQSLTQELTLRDVNNARKRAWDDLVSQLRKAGLLPPAEPEAFDFGEALRRIKAGKRCARKGWNGKGMWIAYSPGSMALPAERFWSPANRDYAVSNGGSADVRPYITMKAADGAIIMGWLASQTDMLAEDWHEVE